MKHHWRGFGFSWWVPHFFLALVLRSSRPSGRPRAARSPILPFMRPHSESGSPLGSVASRVRVSAVSTKLEFCGAPTCEHHCPHSTARVQNQAPVSAMDQMSANGGIWTATRSSTVVPGQWCTSVCP